MFYFQICNDILSFFRVFLMNYLVLLRRYEIGIIIANFYNRFFYNKPAGLSCKELYYGL